MTIPLDPAEGRRLYGVSPGAYAAGRPDYPERVYEALRQSGLTRRARVLEIGPGAGLVTRRLLDAGAVVTAVEPNANMADHLRSGLGDGLEVVAQPFEEADLGDGVFDLAVAATSFHWVRPAEGWRNLRTCLRSGAWAVIWWMLFQDPGAPDDFDWSVHDIVGGDPSLRPDPASTPFQLLTDAREGEFLAAGFEEVSSEVLRTAYLLGADQVRSLYATTAVVLRLEQARQRDVLDRLHRLVREEYGGQIERTFVTALYRGRNS